MATLSLTKDAWLEDNGAGSYQSNFVLYQLIESINDDMVAHGLPPIDSRQALNIVQAVDEAMKKRQRVAYVKFKENPPGNYTAEMLATLDENNPKGINANAYAQSMSMLLSSYIDVVRDLYNNTNDDWKNYLDNGFNEYLNTIIDTERGITTNAAGETRANFNKEVSALYLNNFTTLVQSKNMIPISPYDPRFANTESMLDAVTDIRFANIYTMQDVPGKTICEQLADPNTTIHLRKIATQPNDVLHRRGLKARYLKLRQGESDFVPKGVLYGTSDRISLSALREYCDYSQFKMLMSNMENFSLLNGGAYTAIPPTMMNKALAILDHLDKQGFRYDLVPDSKPGQIKARLNDLRMDVRIIDLSINGENYVGRVFKDGSTIRMSQVSNSRGENEGLNLSIEETLLPLRFALGEDIKRVNGQSIEDNSSHISGKDVVNDAYFSSSAQSGVMINYDESRNLSIRVESNNEAPTFFASIVNTQVDGGKDGHERAIHYLEERILSAQISFVNHVNVDMLLGAFERNRNAILANDYEFSFSNDPTVAQIQRTYWNYMLENEKNRRALEEGRISADEIQTPYLVHPGFDQDELLEAIENVEGKTKETLRSMLHYEVEVKGSGPIKTTEEMRTMFYSHLANSYRDLIGSLNREPIFTMQDILEGRDIDDVMKDENGSRRTFNPAMVSRYMDSSQSVSVRNRSLVQAMRAANVSPNELISGEYTADVFKDAMIVFDEDSAKSIDELRAEGREFEAKACEVALETLHRYGYTGVSGDGDIKISLDDNGIIKWEAGRLTSRTGSTYRDSVGFIGQIFPQDENGLVRTKYAGSENVLVVPGYEGRFIPQRQAENPGANRMERMRLTSFEQRVFNGIRQSILDSSTRSLTEYNDHVSLNFVYRGGSVTRYSEDQFENWREQGFSEEEIAARIRTDANKVSFGNDFAERASILATMDESSDPRNGSRISAFTLLDQKDINTIDYSESNVFDPHCITLGGKQGSVRVLVTGAKVNEDGSVTPSEIEGDMSPINMMRYGENKDHDPSNRRAMSYMASMHAERVVRDANVAYLGSGFNSEDAVIISKAFAERNTVVSKDPLNKEQRPLRIGDKLSDFHGNKGVVSVVVDPDMSDEEAQAQGVLDLVKIMRENPELDIIQSPYSMISRFNAGTILEAQQGAQTLKVNGKEYPGAMGKIDMCVLDKQAEGAVRLYDVDGRSASSIMTNAFSNCPNIINELYVSGNSNSAAVVKEWLNVIGYDIDDTGRMMRFGEDTASGVNRHKFMLPKVEDYETGTRGKDKIKYTRYRDMVEVFAKSITFKGGSLMLPFTLESHRVAKHTDDGKPVLDNHNHQQYEVITLPQDKETGLYELPVLDSALRFGQELQDGSSVRHDYTKIYMRIYENALRYQEFDSKIEELIAGGASKNAEEIKKLEDSKKMLVNDSQAQYSRMVDEVLDRRINNKRNIFKQQFLSNRLNRSATSVWTPNPNLSLNEVGMSKEMMDSLGVKEGERLLVWRDPVWSDKGIMYLKAHEVEGLAGIQIHPSNPQAMDGDFDGDQVGMVKLNDPKACNEAMAKFSPEYRLLNVISSDKDNPNGEYGLNINTGLDIQYTLAKNPDLKEDFDSALKAINDVFKASRTPQKEAFGFTEGFDFENFYIEQETLFEEVDDLMKKIYQHCSEDPAVLDLKNPIESIRKYSVETGAKGNEKRLQQLAQFINEPVHEEYNVSASQATAIQGQFVGIAGSAEQALISISRGLDNRLAKERERNGQPLDLGGHNVMEKQLLSQLQHAGTPDAQYPVASSQDALMYLGYLATQKMLDSKHSATDALRAAVLVKNGYRALMEGKRIVEGEVLVRHNGVDEPMKVYVAASNSPEENLGFAEPMTQQEWINSAYQFLTDSEYGFGRDDINRKVVEIASTALVVTNEFGEKYIGDFSRKGVTSDYGKEASLVDALAFNHSDKIGLIHQAAMDKRVIFDCGADVYEPYQMKQNRRLAEMDDDKAKARIKPIVSKNSIPWAGYENYVKETLIDLEKRKALVSGSLTKEAIDNFMANQKPIASKPVVVNMDYADDIDEQALNNDYDDDFTK